METPSRFFSQNTTAKRFILGRVKHFPHLSPPSLSASHHQGTRTRTPHALTIWFSKSLQDGFPPPAKFPKWIQPHPLRNTEVHSSCTVHSLHQGWPRKGGEGRPLGFGSAVREEGEKAPLGSLTWGWAVRVWMCVWGKRAIKWMEEEELISKQWRRVPSQGRRKNLFLGEEGREEAGQSSLCMCVCWGDGSLN